MKNSIEITNKINILIELLKDGDDVERFLGKTKTDLVSEGWSSSEIDKICDGIRWILREVARDDANK